MRDVDSLNNDINSIQRSINDTTLSLIKLAHAVATCQPIKSSADQPRPDQAERSARSALAHSGPADPLHKNAFSEIRLSSPCLVTSHDRKRSNQQCRSATDQRGDHVTGEIALRSGFRGKLPRFRNGHIINSSRSSRTSCFAPPFFIPGSKKAITNC